MSLLLKADARHIPLADGSVHCCVTSPPYYGLRDYEVEPSVWGGEPGCDHAFELETVNPNGCGSGLSFRRDREAGMRRGQVVGAFCQCGAWRGVLGLEPTIDLYLAHIVEVFREVRRVLRNDATLWLNLGDSYNGSGLSGGRNPAIGGTFSFRGAIGEGRINAGLKPKDLCMLPARVALALQADGWWLRSDIIWSKPNPSPESVTDRPTKAHEYLFLLSKNERYYYNAEVVMEPTTGSAQARGNGVNPKAAKWPNAWSQEEGRHDGIGEGRYRPRQNESWSAVVTDPVNTRNKRSVWTIATEPYSGAHFATFPSALVEPCIRAGCPDGGIVLDPFGGSGVVAATAFRLGRRFVHIDLKYQELARERIPPMAFLTRIHGEVATT